MLSRNDKLESCPLMNKISINVQTFSILLFISVVIFLFDNFGVLKVFQRGAYFITNPISFGIYSGFQNISKQLYFLSAARLAAQENKALKDQLAQLISENADLRRRFSESASMVIQEHFLDPQKYNLIASRPIGLNRYLKIDQGADRDLKVGQPVVYKDNYIGRLTQVLSKTSNVLLLTDPDSKIAAFSINKEGNSKGVITGRFGTEIIMEQILHEEKIEIGDLVYSEGSEGFLPRGLVLGKVTEVIDEQNQPFKTAKLKPVFDFRDLELVFVIGE